jgi:NTP pyrophosphatase (non-canonical NTP hydrolase)
MYRYLKARVGRLDSLPQTISGVTGDSVSTPAVPAGDLNELAAWVHQANRQWWLDLETGQPLVRNKAELLCLIHSEISECLEGIRRNAPDAKLPHRSAEEVELVDALIRILDYAGGFGLDLQGAFREKMAFNRQRADHSLEHRRGTHGKKF